MKNKILVFVMPLPDINHGLSTWMTFWEEKFTTVNITNCGSCNVMKHRDINNCEQYIISVISSMLDCLNKR